MPNGAPWRIGATARAHGAAAASFGSKTVIDTQRRAARGRPRAAASVVHAVGSRGRRRLPARRRGRSTRAGRTRTTRSAGCATRSPSRPRAPSARYDAELAPCPGEARAASGAEQARAGEKPSRDRGRAPGRGGERLRAIREGALRELAARADLLLASVLVTGPSANAVSVEGFLDQRPRWSAQARASRRASASRASRCTTGCVLRAGTYLEPSRYDRRRPRASTSRSART